MKDKTPSNNEKNKNNSNNSINHYSSDSSSEWSSAEYALEYLKIIIIVNYKVLSSLRKGF
jgi:hypothetical protein